MSTTSSTRRRMRIPRARSGRRPSTKAPASTRAVLTITISAPPVPCMPLPCQKYSKTATHSAARAERSRSQLPNARCIITFDRVTRAIVQYCAQATLAPRRRSAGNASVHDLLQLAGFVARGHLVERDGLDLRGHARAAELLVPLRAHLLRRGHRRLQVLARVELRAVLGHVAADRAGHRQADVGVDIDLA